MSKHTPGPWTRWTQTDPDISEPSAHVALISHIFVVGAGELGNPHADARLIAAAPEMLAALRVVSGTDLHHEILDIVDAAISKAEGRS
jgi:hypothetical protein